MNGHAALRQSLSHEEKMGLLDDRTLSDVESEGSSSSSTAVDIDSRPIFDSTKPHTYTSFAVAPSDFLRSTPWRSVIIRTFVFLTPSFLQGRHAREQICPAKLSPTAYLDGMRGLAALFVFFCHYFYQAFVIAEGWGCDTTNYHILKLPFLRLWYQGPPAVCVFFVISGYALSYRPLKLIRSRSFSDFSTTMSSLVFRRGIRLYLPTAISTFMIIGLLRIGAYEWTRDFANDRKYMKIIVEPHPARMESAYAQYRDWAIHMYRFIHVFGWDKFGGSTSYDVHLWTIPVEFRCSLYLFLVIIGTARLQTRFRFLVVGSIMCFVYRHSRWELFLFYCGMLLAEWDHSRGAHTPTPALPVDEKLASGSRPLWKRMFWIMVSILGLYLMCQPDGRGEITPGWVYLSSLIPRWWAEEKYRYWQSTGAVIFVLAVGHCKGWQRFFNTPVVQYFGKISYALYLMHGPAMHTVGYHWEKWAYGVTGVQGYWYNTGFVLGSVFCIPTVIWWADVFWRAVDIPTVKFAKWVEQKCIARD
ncbi:acyltransferase [Purpureocillium lavendulum]|uniref:Acyltransferase n=1 Tax=Purpureocillium lavendulum TaxID=1247861 RepID=A0AB34FMM5_9HYPO|nr:acyltransferase [Purpureocillium lavendulum]